MGSSSHRPFLSISPQRDRASNPILLLHTAVLPAASTPPFALSAQVATTLARLPPSTPYTLVILNAGQASVAPTTRYGVNAVRAAFEHDDVVPPDVRARLAAIVAVHVSFLTRAQIYMASFGMAGGEYAKLTYCDLLEDLEKHLGVDSTLLGLEKVDFDYDEQMRCWVGRQYDHKPLQAPDPSKPLLDLDNLDLSRNDPVPQPPQDPESITPVAHYP